MSLPGDGASASILQWLRAAALVAALLCFIAGCDRGEQKGAGAGGSGGPEGAGGGPPVVYVTEAVRADVPVVREWVGTLDGSANAEIHARVAGAIVSKDYPEGAFVRKGQPLFHIDRRPFEATVSQAKADQARAQATLLKGELDLRRATTLIQSKTISQQDYDNAVQAAASARAESAARAAAVEAAELNLSYTTVEAPIDGIAGQAQVQVGYLVGPSTGVLTTISTVDPIKAYVSLSEPEYLDALPRLRRQAELPLEQRPANAEMILGTGELYPYRGKFDFADREVEARTGTLRVGSIFPNPNNVLRPGQFARIRVTVTTETGVLAVPQRAVKELQGSYQVAVVGPDNRASIRPVKTGARAGQLWAITEGLSPGERVVVEGIQKVRDGAPVRPQPWNPDAATGQPASPGTTSPGAPPLPSAPTTGAQGPQNVAPPASGSRGDER